MPTDLSLPLRKAVIQHLEQDAALTAVVPANRIYSMAVPAVPVWPFIRYGTPINTGYEASCWDGMDSTITIHAFSESSNGKSGEDEAMTISQLIINAMANFHSDELAVVDNIWINGQILRDEPEADRYHAVIEFNMVVVRKH